MSLTSPVIPDIRVDLLISIKLSKTIGRILTFQNVAIGCNGKIREFTELILQDRDVFLGHDDTTQPDATTLPGGIASTQDR
jgi:hypothetical protein